VVAEHIDATAGTRAAKTSDASTLGMYLLDVTSGTARSLSLTRVHLVQQRFESGLSCFVSVDLHGVLGRLFLPEVAQAPRARRRAMRGPRRPPPAPSAQPVGCQSGRLGGPARSYPCRSPRRSFPPLVVRLSAVRAAVRDCFHATEPSPRGLAVPRLLGPDLRLAAVWRAAPPSQEDDAPEEGHRAENRQAGGVSGTQDRRGAKALGVGVGTRTGAPRRAPGPRPSGPREVGCRGTHPPRTRASIPRAGGQRSCSAMGERTRRMAPRGREGAPRRLARYEKTPANVDSREARPRRDPARPDTLRTS
jgi:hypothetical protein